jgi:hypothetical protein
VRRAAAQRRVRRYATLVILAAGGLVAAGCSPAKPQAVQLNPQAVSGSGSGSTGRSTGPSTPQYFQISPAPGATDAGTASGITVSALRGAKIANVTVATR